MVERGVVEYQVTKREGKFEVVARCDGMAGWALLPCEKEARRLAKMRLDMRLSGEWPW